MKVIVTGGTGFLGRFVVRRLVEAHDVVCLVRNLERGEALGTTLVHADLDDASATHAAFDSAGADALVNVASLGFGHAPAIVSAAERSGITRAVYVSTTGVTTKLDPPSKRVRLAAEATIVGSGIPSTIIRPTMIYGAPGDRNMERLLKVLARTPIFPVPGAHHLHQPVHVDDLAAAIVSALGREAAGTMYDVPGPAPLRFDAIVRTAAIAVGRRVRTMPVPSRPLVAALSLAERLGDRAPLKAEQVLRLLEDKAFDVGPAREDLGHEPRSFEDGITEEATLLGLRR
jgi:nucleoside-diphosphate-sugar epimerase